MISSNEYILVYNQLFKYIDEDFGKDDVIELWKSIGKNCKMELDKAVREKKLKGLYEHFKRVWGSEGGRHTITLRDEELVLDMHYCPSVGKILNSHLDPYEYYCEHCSVLYPHIIEKYGELKADFYIVDQNTGQCRRYIRKKK